MSVAEISLSRAGEVPVDRAPRFPRKPKGISGRSIAIIVFLTICAAFFCVPLYIIITTSFIKEAGITVNRAEAVTAEHKDNGNILVAIRPNGDIWMDKRPVDIRDVRLIIERLHTERPDDTVVIIADRESETGVLTQVMDQVKLGGIAEVSIAAAPLL